MPMEKYSSAETAPKLAQLLKIIRIAKTEN
jgi:hypothetical protein